MALPIYKDKIIGALEVCREKGASSFILSEVLRLKIEVIIESLKELMEEGAISQNSNGHFVLLHFKEGAADEVLNQIKYLRQSLKEKSESRTVSPETAVYLARVIKGLLKESK